MRFLDLYISGFGKFHDTAVSFEDGLNAVSYTHLDVYKRQTQAYAQGAKRMGVEFLTYTEVTGLQTKAGRIHAVETTNGTFELSLIHI